MSREIRRVPPNWSHPTQMRLSWVPGLGYRMELAYVPMHDLGYEDAVAVHAADLSLTQDGVPDPGRAEAAMAEARKALHPRNYRPYPDREATWFQVFQTVSEGTPVSPPYPTMEELAAYLAGHGDFYDQRRVVEDAYQAGRLDPDDLPSAGWGKEAAEAFCRRGWAPSGLILNGVASGNAGEAALLMAGG